MTGRNHAPHLWITCPPCGKRGYVKRQAAKAARRSHPDRRDLHVYRCPTNGTVFHLGHHRGRTRDDIRHGRRPAA